MQQRAGCRGARLRNTESSSIRRFPISKAAVMALIARISRPTAPGAPSPAAVVAIAILTGLLAAQPSLGLPQLWVADFAKADCGQHPRQAYGQHKDPVADSATSISFALADPQAVTAASPTTVVCAGSSYTVVVNFGGQLRNVLITASVGTLQPSGKSSGLGSMVAQAVTGISQNLGLLNLYTDTCPGRFSTPILTASVELTLSIPIWATGNLVIQVTSAASALDSFRTAIATAPVLTPPQCSLRSSQSPSLSPSPSPALNAVSTLPLNPSSVTRVSSGTIVLPGTSGSTAGGSSASSVPTTTVDMSGASSSDKQLLEQIAAANSNNSSSLTAATSRQSGTGAAANSRSGAAGVQQGLAGMLAVMLSWILSYMYL